MIFAILMLIGAAALASAAGFFSIYGLAHIYAASALSIIIMGTCMEFGKLITASFLYRYWTRINLALKVYLLVATLALMGITSFGVFGYLTAAYQQDSIPVTQISQTLATDQAELQRTIARKAQIDQQIAKLPDSYVNARKKLISTFSDEYKTLQPNIDRLTKEIASSQTAQLSTEAKVGPVMYVAKTLNIQPDSIIFYLTGIIITVFDPLAVALTIGTNLVFADLKKKKAAVVIEPEVAEEVDPPVQEIMVSSPSTDLVVSKKDEVLNKIRQDISDSTKIS